MKNIKNWLVVSSYTEDEIQTIEKSLYGYTDKVLCIDAFDNGDIRTWYVPYGEDFNIEEGDFLLVEQKPEGRWDYPFVVVEAEGTPYEKSFLQHRKDLHPHMPVIKNLGKKLKQ